MTVCGGVGGINIRDVFYWISTRPYALVRYNIYIDTIRRLQVNILFICTSWFRNRRKISLWLVVFLSFSESTNEFYISRQCTYILFILQCHVCLYCSVMSVYTAVSCLFILQCHVCLYCSVMSVYTAVSCLQ